MTLNSSMHLSILPLVADNLSLSDIKAARLVCKGWNDTLSIPRYFKNAVINITGDMNSGQETRESLEKQYADLSQHSEVLLQLVRSVCFRNSLIKSHGHQTEFWLMCWGSQIRSLKFRFVIFQNDDVLAYMLAYCPNLIHLSFENCVGLSTNGKMPKEFRLDKLESISFVRCNFSMCIYDMLKSNIGHIKSLEFYECFVRGVQNIQNINAAMLWVITVQHGLTHDGYRDEQFILPFISHHASSLSSIVLSKVFVEHLGSVLETEGLSLKKFHWKQFTLLASTAFDCLKESQRSVESICIDNLNVNLHTMMEIKECFPALQHLSLSFRKQLTHLVFSGLAALKNLKHLEIEVLGNLKCEEFVFDGASFMQGIQILKYSGLPDFLNYQQLFGSEPLVNLTCLRLNCTLMVTDDVVHSICRLMTALRRLDLSGCSRITDRGLIGETDKEMGESDCFGLDNLKGLTHLNFSGCINVTDKSLLNALIFKELRVLDLSKCLHISDVGLSSLSKQNPSLEVLKLRGCSGISDKGLFTFFRNAARLKTLDVLHCDKVTVGSIMTMALCCRDLRSVTANKFEDAVEYLSVVPRCAIADSDPPVFAILNDDLSDVESESGSSDASENDGEEESSDDDDDNMLLMLALLM